MNKDEDFEIETTGKETATGNPKPDKPNNSNDKKKKIIIGVTAIVALVILILLLLSRCGSNTVKGDNKLDIQDDQNATDTVISNDHDKVVDELNQKVQDGMINISMNLNPEFANGTSEGNLLIVNSEKNKHPQYVTITRDDNQEVIYKSGSIAVGKTVKTAKLNVNLPSGTYACTALFTQYDESTKTALGSAAAKIKIIVKS